MTEPTETEPTETGTRPPAVRDWLWVALVVLVIAGFLAGAAVTLWDLANDRNRSQVLWLPVGLASAWWLALLAWRRTIWGAGDDEV